MAIISRMMYYGYRIRMKQVRIKVFINLEKKTTFHMIVMVMKNAEKEYVTNCGNIVMF